MIQTFYQNKAFTLVEIMIVVAIIALLASITIPNLNRARLEAQHSTVTKTLRSVADAMELYSATEGEYPTSWSPLFNATPPYLSASQFGASTVTPIGTTGLFFTAYEIKQTEYDLRCSFLTNFSYYCSSTYPSSLGTAGYDLGYKQFRVDSGEGVQVFSN